jgi:hypothetical protein
MKESLQAKDKAKQQPTCKPLMSTLYSTETTTMADVELSVWNMQESSCEKLSATSPITPASCKPRRCTKDENLAIVGTRRAVFGFMVRDGSFYLERNMRTILKAAAALQDYRLVYVENDSKDTTRDILSRIEAEFPPHVVGLKLTNFSATASRLLCTRVKRNCFERTNLLAELRMKVLRLSIRHAESAWGARWDAFVALDMDFVYFPAKDFLEAFALGITRRAVAVFGNSQYLSSKLEAKAYDAGVILPPSAQIMARHGCVVEVQSAFGGVGIYFADALLAAQPSYAITPGETALRPYEHMTFNRAFYNYSVLAQRPLLLDGRLKPFYLWGEHVGEYGVNYKDRICGRCEQRHAGEALYIWPSNANWSTGPLEVG